MPEGGLDEGRKGGELDDGHVVEEAMARSLEKEVADRVLYIHV